MRQLIEKVVVGAALLAALTVWLTAPALAAAPADVDVGHEHPEPVVLAPGYADLSFEPPPPGSYRMPPLGAAADGPVLDTGGRARRLHDFMGDRLVVLSFIYTSCGDVNGCPLATHVFSRVADVLDRADGLREQVRMISMSFDPDFDTPTVMRAYGQRYQRGNIDWQFLTSRSVVELEPTLAAYDQWVVRDFDETGKALGTMSHLLRVYLIDRERRIRNIYSVSFLHADTIANDIRTLLAEAALD